MGNITIKVPADFEVPPIPETIRFKVKRTADILTLTIQEIPTDILEMIGKAWIAEMIQEATVPEEEPEPP